MPSLKSFATRSVDIFDDDNIEIKASPMIIHKKTIWNSIFTCFGYE